MRVAEGVQSIPLTEYANLDVNLPQLGAGALDFGFLMPELMVTDYTAFNPAVALQWRYLSFTGHEALRHYLNSVSCWR